MNNYWNGLPNWLRLSIIFPLGCLNGWILFTLIGYLQPLGTILTTAALLAFLLDLPINALEKWGIRRVFAITIVLLIFLITLNIITLFLVPLIVEQLSELLSNLPQWIESGNKQIIALKEWAITEKIPIDLQSIMGQFAQKISLVLKSLGNQFLSLIGGTLGTIFNILLTLVLTVFLVFTGGNITQGILSWIPSPWNHRFQELLRKTFESYFATQAILAGILSIAQTIVFIILQVPYAVLFGFTIGFTTLIPYASAFTIIIISVLLMFQNFQLGITALILTVIVGQINDNIISPRLMGGMTGLNPVWIVVSLFIGGKFAGVLGLIIAVPLASVIKTTIDMLRYPPESDDEIITVENQVKEELPMDN
ncbi:MAG TPA: AI-2E family transporter [Cyanothece sp. UBA12306]|nr:AI-2E family transporter [Cyanothece sp. UBA12306]